VPSTPDQYVRSRREGQAYDDEPQQAPTVRRHQRWSSRQLHRLGAVASHAWAACAVLGVALVWVAWGVASGFPSYWPVILESVTSIVTVVMLFALQHMEARDQRVVQRKLDEILRSIPQADNQLIASEEAPDEHLEALTELNRQDRFT
jgi:low affinity Fe/Cu permease